MNDVSPPIVCIIGRKNAGKTGLTVALGAELNRRGFRVMTVKHAHGFQLDQPGRDSWRHRHEGGAIRTVLASPSDFAVVGGWPQEEMPLSELVGRFLSDADIVLAEGFKSSNEAKVEVFRDEPNAKPLFQLEEEHLPETLALVTDRPGMEASIPVFDLNNLDHIGNLVDLIQGRFLGGDKGS